MWLLLLALTAAEAEPLAALRFDGPEARLTLRSLGEGRAVVEGGTLLLNLTAPRRGKAASASLDLELPLPCRLTWEQCLEADSPHAYLAGAALSGQRGAPLLLTL
ncbi:MAG: hypothetical protein HUU35_05990, partial [Armatimonadetes bacterium]|nr:hypothetical protein [Armatimonadota bacterium]